MQFVLKHGVQCLQWYITLVVSFASYPCNEHKTDVGRPKCESDASIVRNVICNKNMICANNKEAAQYLCWSNTSTTCSSSVS